ncbi:MAG: AAA family ATPase [Gammaproteobacteria bacterium]
MNASQPLARPPDDGGARFDSHYDRYAALALARLVRAGTRAMAAVFILWDVRRLLDVPARGPDRPRNMLQADEIEALAAALDECRRGIDDGAWIGAVFSNAGVLAARLELDDAEHRLLILATMARCVEALGNALEALAPQMRDRTSAARILAAMLDCPAEGIAAALRPDARLARTGLVHLRASDDTCIPLVVRDGFAALLAEPHASPQDVFAGFAAPERPARLGIDDYAHLRADVDLLSALLARACATDEVGINVLLYGPPGTGKTELARVLAAHTGLELFGVRHRDESGEDLTRARMSQALLAQALLAPARGALLLFDEAEDLLPPQGPADGRAIGKAAFNHLLENNAVPMVWTANEIGHIDRAFLRRFVCIVEVRPPSRALRARIAARAFTGTGIEPDRIRAMAAPAGITPAQIGAAARVARLVGTTIDPADAAIRTLTNGMRALGQAEMTDSVSDRQFDRRFLNCGVDIDSLVAAVAATGHGCLLFHGPPGTGKSALARDLARASDRELIVRRASDLQSPWIGQCERNIAAAFREAAEERAVLLLDEADTFLLDRRHARARWEFSETNELMTQMERFEGIFVCTTNMADLLDRACMRRFGLKLRFDYLRPDQATELALRSILQLGEAVAPSDARIAEIARLPRLAPGDFSAAMARLRLVGTRTPAASLLVALREEIAMRGGGSGQRIGF